MAAAADDHDVICGLRAFWRAPLLTPAGVSAERVAGKRAERKAVHLARRLSESRAKSQVPVAEPK